MAYRFFYSLLVGFLLGTCYTTLRGKSPFKSFDRFACSRMPYSDVNNSVEEFVNKHPKYLPAQEGLLYIGVMSTQKNMNTRVAAMLNTWARHPNVKLEIFANNSEISSTESVSDLISDSGATVISLPGVPDISYPPQKKSFSMMKYIHDNHLNKFQWFLRADDDAYVKIEELLRFLSKINPSKPHLIGRPGFGKHEDDYLFGDNYCMGGTGVLLSRELLRQVGPKLSQCLRQMYTEHEDIELGRCVRTMTGVSCTTAWETSRLFYQNFNGHGSYGNNIEEVSERKRADALTLHANKDPVYQYKLHLSLLSDRIADVLLKICKTEIDTRRMLNLLASKMSDDRAWNMHAGYIWNTIGRKSMYSLKSRSMISKVHPAVKEALTRNMYYIISEVRKMHRALRYHIDEIVLPTTRYFVNPLISVDMIAKLKIRMKLKHTKAYAYLNNVHFRRSFSNSVVYLKENHAINPELIKDAVSQIDANLGRNGFEIGAFERINFVLALSGRLDNLQRFLKNFEEAFLAIGENVSLTIVYYLDIATPVTTKTEQIIDVDQASKLDDVSHVTSDIDLIQSILTSLSEKYPKHDLKLVPVKNSSFSRGAGLQIGAQNVDEDEIIFFCDVDLVFSSDLLFHIRRTTIKGKQVYYPIVFSQYDPRIVYSYLNPPDTLFYHEEIAGFWSSFSYGMVSIYKSDFFTTGGFDLSIRGWGLEDLRLYETILKKRKLQIFRTNDPAIVHVHHDKDCSSDLTGEQKESCSKSRAQHFAPQTLMYYLWQRHKEDEERTNQNDPMVKAK